MNNPLGLIETGNEIYLRWVITAPVIAPTAASTAVTFTRVNPDRTTATASSPDAAIIGPTAGSTVVDGVTLTTTTWHWKTPLFTQPGTSTVRARSTAGILCSENRTIATPPHSPLPP